MVGQGRLQAVERRGWEWENVHEETPDVGHGCHLGTTAEDA